MGNFEKQKSVCRHLYNPMCAISYDRLLNDNVVGFVKGVVGEGLEYQRGDEESCILYVSLLWVISVRGAGS